VPLDVVVDQLEVPEAERPNVRELLQALGRLPFNQRAAITMRELEGRSHTEIAETLGVTVPAAEALIGRARRTLRSQAQAIKGLTVVQLPQSLRSVFRPGEAAGGAVGSAAAAKVLALLAAGVVAGGAGLAGQGDAQRPAAAPKQPLERVLVAVPSAQSTHARSATVAVRRRIAAPRAGRRAAGPGYGAPAGRRPKFDTSDGAPPSTARSAPTGASPATSASEAASAAASSRPIDSVQARTATDAVPQAAASAATTVAQAPEAASSAAAQTAGAASSTVTQAAAAAATTVAETTGSVTAAPAQVSNIVQTATNAVTSQIAAPTAGAPPPARTAPPAVPQPPPAPTVTIP
jgi:hypothetical protein